MKAFVLESKLKQGKRNWVETTLEVPKPGPSDLLVKVKAISVNPVDVKLRASDWSPETGPAILGFDAAGVVESIGSEVTLFKPGDEVYYAGDVRRGGTNAEYHVVQEAIVGRKPKNLSYQQSAALPLTGITAWESLFDRLKVQNSEAASILVIGAAGGVGSMVIQLAKRLTSHRVIATASRPESVRWCQELGADVVIDHSKNLLEQIEQLGIQNIKFVLSLTESEFYRDQIAALIMPQGSLLLIDDPKIFDIVPFKHKSIQVHWELMFTRSLYQTPDLIEQHHLLNQISELCERGKIKTSLTEVLQGISVENLELAHQRLSARKAIGKIVLAE